MIIFVLLTLWCHGPLSPFLPAAYEPILIAYAQLFPPPLLAVLGALAATMVELPNYFIYRRVLLCRWMSRLRSAPSTRRIIDLFSRWPFVALWILMWSPLPDWGARVLAVHSGYPVQRYLAAVLLARLPRFWLLAVVGFHLGLGADAVFIIIAGSVAIAAAGIVVRRVRSAHRVRARAIAAPVTVAVLLALAVPGVQAQTGQLADGPSTGVTVDRFSYRGYEATAVSYRYSALRSGSVGNEIGVSLFPQALVAGVLLLAPDLGASYNLSLPGATFLGKAGGSMLLGLGRGFAFLPGFHLGAGMILQAEKRAAIRLDVVRHFYLIENRTEGVWSIGIGLTVLPMRRSLPAGP